MSTTRKASLLLIALLISTYTFAAIPDINLDNALIWAGTFWAKLKPFLVAILGIIGAVYLVKLGMLYADESDDEKKKKKFLMGGLILLGSATLLLIIPS
ncbi:MAG: hypothetical protein JKY54_01660 [Flavobacteriales bacterium]|nr:hypothetical protein [Flavobacteriales bacterium]